MVSKIIYEKCNEKSMTEYPSFLDHLSRIQSVVKQIDAKLTSKCEKCNQYPVYRIGNLVWTGAIKHKIETHGLYPGDFFIKTIMNMVVENGSILNPPIEINPDNIFSVQYIPLRHNQLNILDALMQQGSQQRYSDNTGKNFLYSEHSGGIIMENNVVSNIIVSADTNRTDTADKEILLPKNSPDLIKYEYLFHTHPNAKMNGGRIKDGVLYEFPSASDIYNFIKYYNEGKAQASVVIAPEGSYVIRPKKSVPKLINDTSMYYGLKKFILQLEKKAIGAKKEIITKGVSDPNIFNKEIASDTSFVRMYNKFIKPLGIFVEYYPRVKRNGEWALRTINLFHMNDRGN
jgi:hypothetical protein